MLLSLVIFSPCQPYSSWLSMTLYTKLFIPSVEKIRGLRLTTAYACLVRPLLKSRVRRRRLRLQLGEASPLLILHCGFGRHRQPGLRRPLYWRPTLVVVELHATAGL